MKIVFEDKSYIEANKSQDNNVIIVISAKDQNNSLKKITNAVQITMEEFKKLFSDIL